MQKTTIGFIAMAKRDLFQSLNIKTTYFLKLIHCWDGFFPIKEICDHVRLEKIEVLSFVIIFFAEINWLTTVYLENHGWKGAFYFLTSKSQNLGMVWSQSLKQQYHSANYGDLSCYQISHVTGLYLIDQDW